MHDLLFSRQDEWSGDPEARQLFAAYAEQLGLDIEQYRADFEDAADRVDEDVRIAEESGVQSTPTFYLNGKEIEDLESFENLRQHIEAELETSPKEAQE
jgi:protein-disulfide isomerase